MMHRRSLFGVGTILLVGCLENTPTGGDGEEKEPPNDNSESESGDDIPYDIPRSFTLVGKFITKSDIESGFTVLPSEDDRFDDHGLYRELFQAVENVPEQERRVDLEVVADNMLSPDSEQGIALRETVANIRTEMDATTHKNDRWESRWGTHYVEHDGSTLMVFLQGPGTPEEGE